MEHSHQLMVQVQNMTFLIHILYRFIYEVEVETSWVIGLRYSDKNHDNNKYYKVYFSFPKLI